MKTQILQLDPHDDIISARDKMGWGQAARFVLVWPARGRVLHRRIDLVLLQRHSHNLGAQMALVSTDPDVKYYARELKIPVFKSLRQAQSANWRSRRRRRLRIRRALPRPDYRLELEEIRPKRRGALGLPVVRRGIELFGIVLVLAIALALIPAARVTLQPEERMQALTLPVSAGPDISAVNLSGQLPARWRTVEVEGRDSLTTTGTTAVPESLATGAVRFSNLTESAVQVPEDTIVSTTGPDPVRFRITQAGVVEAGLGRVASLPVQALLPGEQGNLPAGAIRAIEGPLGLALTVTNAIHTGGGAMRRVPAPAAQDFEHLQEQLTETLRQTALEELRSTAEPGSQNFVIQDSLELKQVLDEVYIPSPLADGSIPAGSQLELTLRLEFRALVISASDLRALAGQVLDANLPEGFASQNEGLEIDFSDPVLSADETSYGWDVFLVRKIYGSISAEEVSRQVAGLTVPEAQDHLGETLPVRGESQIRVEPDWWPRLPFAPFRIAVSVER